MPTGAMKVKVGTQYQMVNRGPRGESGALTGEMKMWLGAAAPTGYLLAQGQPLSTTTYVDLFNVIGYTYGGSGATFNLPDMQVRVPVGAGSGKALGASDLLPVGSRNASRIHSHNHTAGSASSTTVAIAGAYTGIWAGVTNVDHNHVLSASDHGVATNTPTTGGANRATGGAHGSSGMSAQANVNHDHGIGDPTHGHAGSTGSTTTTTTVNANTTAEDPFVVVNYIVKV